MGLGESDLKEKARELPRLLCLRPSPPQKEALPKAGPQSMRRGAPGRRRIGDFLRKGEAIRTLEQAAAV